MLTVKFCPGIAATVEGVTSTVADGREATCRTGFENMAKEPRSIKISKRKERIVRAFLISLLPSFSSRNDVIKAYCFNRKRKRMVLSLESFPAVEGLH
jgi:hypothetical protein